jgi:16S rRNA (guanine527-N7)-methyltransferase
MKEKFTELLLGLDIDLTEKQYQDFIKYYNLLVEWNTKTNLTAITEFEDVFIKHFYDSLCITKTINFDSQTLLDVGSGAGFPSIPLKIIYNDIKVTIVDSLGKRITFLAALKNELDIDVELIHDRAENHPLKNNYDIVTARAVSNLQVLSELCIPFVKVGGYFIALKGPRYKEELEASLTGITILGADKPTIKEYNILDQKRALISCKKITKTQDKYPRNYSQIKTKPL